MKIKIWIWIAVLIGMITASAQARETIPVAAIYALTGQAAEAHSAPVQGVTWAVSEINAAGGLLGRQVELLVLDNRSSPIGSSVAAEKAQKKHVAAIVGSAWSSHSLAIARVAQQYGIPMVSCQSTNPKVTLVGPYIFRVCFTDQFQGQMMARFARQNLKAGTAVVFTKLDSDYSVGLSDIFMRNFKLLHGKVIREIEYKSNTRNLSDQITTARKADADVVFFTGHDETGHIAKLLQQKGIRSIPLGGDGWMVDSFFEKGGNTLKKAYFCSHWSPDSTDTASRQFVKSYGAKEHFGVGSALSYDAMMVLAHAIRMAGSIDRDRIREALAHVKNYLGVSGTISFNADGDPVKSAVIMKIQNGRPVFFEILQPEP